MPRIADVNGRYVPSVHIEDCGPRIAEETDLDRREPHP